MHEISVFQVQDQFLHERVWSRFLDVLFFGQDCSSDRMSLLEILFFSVSFLVRTRGDVCYQDSGCSIWEHSTQDTNCLGSKDSWSHYDWSILKPNACKPINNLSFFQGVQFNPALSVLDAFKKTCSWMFFSHNGWLKKQSFDLYTVFFQPHRCGCWCLIPLTKPTSLKQT